MSGLPSPALQIIGGAVLLQREAVLLVTRFVDLGIEQHRKVNGISSSPPVQQMQTLLHRAAPLALEELQALRRSDVQAMAEMSPLNKPRKDEIGAREAADILSLSPRQVTRIASSLSGTGGSQGKPWRFSRAEVESYKESLRTS